jgi:hypothetical protein
LLLTTFQSNDWFITKAPKDGTRVREERRDKREVHCRVWKSRKEDGEREKDESECAREREDAESKRKREDARNSQPKFIMRQRA